MAFLLEQQALDVGVLDDMGTWGLLRSFWPNLRALGALLGVIQGCVVGGPGDAGGGVAHVQAGARSSSGTCI